MTLIRQSTVKKLHYVVRTDGFLSLYDPLWYHKQYVYCNLCSSSPIWSGGNLSTSISATSVSLSSLSAPPYAFNLMNISRKKKEIMAKWNEVKLNKNMQFQLQSHCSHHCSCLNQISYFRNVMKPMHCNRSPWRSMEYYGRTFYSQTEENIDL